MIPFAWRIGLGEMFPYSNFHDMNLDWIIATVKNDKGELEEMQISLPNMVNNAVEDYFEQHPPVAIQNNSIDSLKLKYESIPFYNVKDYGIIPDNGDVYRQLHDFLNTIVYPNGGGIVYFPKGLYTLSFTVFIPQNTVFIGDGDDTVIYFDETDTDFGVALCNAGSNVSIMNMCVSQRDTGVFHSGAQVGCIGLGDISALQCTEPAYSHNYIRTSEVHNLVVENVTFIGKYPIQTEPASGKVTNVLYKNLKSEGAISAQTSENAEIDNLYIVNCTGDIIRLISGIKNKNITIQNSIVNSLYITNASPYPISLTNVIGTTSNKNNDITNYKYAFAGELNLEKCILNESPDTGIGIGIGVGIHKFTDCVFNFTTKRAFIREAPLSSITNYDVFTNCRMNSAENENTSIILGYGNNNIIEGNITAWLYGNCYIKRLLTGSISYTNPNNWTLQDNVFTLNYTCVIDSSTVFTFPTTFVFPIERTLPIPVRLWNHTTGAVKQTWALITEGSIVIQEQGIDYTVYDRASITHTFPLTRIPYPTELYSLTQ